MDKMNKERIYFDTSVPSAYYDKRTKERMELTRTFWEHKIGGYELHVSNLVIDELSQTEPLDLKKKLLKLIDRCEILKIDNEAEVLANAYLEAGILPQKYFNDALHISVATVNGIKFIVSWNFQHFVNVKTRQMVNLVNLREGYGVIEIIAPPEL